jgi:hypothetical protein
MRQPLASNGQVLTRLENVPYSCHLEHVLEGFRKLALPFQYLRRHINEIFQQRSLSSHRHIPACKENDTQHADLKRVVAPTFKSVTANTFIVKSLAKPLRRIWPRSAESKLLPTLHARQPKLNTERSVGVLALALADTLGGDTIYMEARNRK